MGSEQLKLTAEQIGELERLQADSQRYGLKAIYALGDLMTRHAPALIAAAKREAEPRCPECNGELSSCGTATIDGPSTYCRACLLNDLLRAMQARATSAEQRAVEAEGRVKELETINIKLSAELVRRESTLCDIRDDITIETRVRNIARTALAQPPEELYRTELENDELNRQQANRQIQEENP